MKKPPVVGIVLLIGIGGLTSRVTTHAGAAENVECTAAGLQAGAPSGTTITAAKVVGASGNVPEFCQVEGQVRTPGKTVVNLALALPDASSWNGKLFFGGRDVGLARGYASASSDAQDVARLMLATDPTQKRERGIDFGHRGTHLATVTAKALAATYYGRSPQHSYFSGCSAGGRAGMIEVQRYPEDFDGVIAAGPGFGTRLQIFRAIVYQTMLAKAENYLPVAKVELLSRATLADCDAKDGLKDGLISDPRLCGFKPESLRCSGADAPDCLTAGQIDTVRKIYGGVKDAAGKLIVPGLPIGHEGGPTGWQGSLTGPIPPTAQPDGTLKWPGPEGTRVITGKVPNGFGYGEQYFRSLVIPDADWLRFDVDQDLAKTKAMADLQDPTDPDLRPFKRQGGKLILWHGWADPMITAYWTLSYYENVVKAMGGQRETDEFVRLFLPPGMHHCSGGPGTNSFDMLSTLENWVEQGVAPDNLVASHSTNGRIDRSRPLCAYPKVARYVGTGSIDEATNFRCEAPQPR